MRNYNDLTNATKGILAFTGLLASLVIAGCASAPESGRVLTPAPQPQAATPLPPRPKPQTRHISTHELRQAVDDDAPLRYVVKPGDTLWDIADYFMVKPWYWPELWYDNPDIENPHLIYPGDVLILTHVNRRPRIVLHPKVREKPVHKPIPTIPTEAIDVLIDAPRIVSEKQLENAPYIVGFGDQHLMAGEAMTAFVRNLSQSDPPRLDIVAPDGPLIDPETGKQIGFLVLPVGQLVITRRADNVAVARITASERAARPGNRLLPARTRIQVSQYRLHVPEQPIAGKIIATYGDSPLISQYDVAVINRGAVDGLERGHLLQIYQAPKTIEDPVKKGKVTLPPEKIGVMMLFDVNKQTSLGIVLESTEAIHRLDMVRTPDTI